MLYTHQQLQLLNIQYIHPVPFNRFTRLLKENPSLEDLHSYSALQWSRIFNIPIERLEQFSVKFNEISCFPIVEMLKENGVTPITYFHSNYPSELRQLCDPPAVLYTKGNEVLLKKQLRVGIIGSRKATSYSKMALEFIVPPLVDHQIPIVSGLADGADTMAHQAAIEYGGETIGVLGHGFSHMYPKKNQKIAEEMAKNHLLVTEYPPYFPPAKWTFPMRNRIISGLSSALVITESVERSGTMSTVEHALDHGKEIFAVPGAIDSPLSAGPNKLLDEGAKPLWSGYQIVDSLL
ncbi:MULTISPECIES: DNA-processing protein DprA [unclassified Sporosarcina]|uniref:DNA-processing protein DprA n=1 Tax=unclassified Sporosarcina TaxID=2647733 RepID=UPI000C1660DD|nr:MULTISPECIES: DNA-processing protein DprA [unclassified Sporosarcina]PID00150.1 DNA-protecting protein DprA [Sporosarcina sp. P29]PID06833.1 DNA-protecting protein DprA [Sporosarcina sp. P30]PID10028.1 DNA-protecting protein DprA [Sporosarcina sp. P31]PID13607.1 DNA-protecting protein DprA [Sporosarcina sp. P32b]